MALEKKKHWQPLLSLHYLNAVSVTILNTESYRIIKEIGFEIMELNFKDFWKMEMESRLCDCQHDVILFLFLSLRKWYSNYWGGVSKLGTKNEHTALTNSPNWDATTAMSLFLERLVPTPCSNHCASWSMPQGGPWAQHQPSKPQNPLKLFISFELWARTPRVVLCAYGSWVKSWEIKTETNKSNIKPFFKIKAYLIIPGPYHCYQYQMRSCIR